MAKAKTTTKRNAKKGDTKKGAKAKTKPTAAKKKLSALDAAARVLAESGGSMTTKELVEQMAAKKLWESPNGKTPAATLYAGLLREIATKGKDSRFKKTEPGHFAATSTAKTASEVETPAPKAVKSKGKKAAEPTAPAEAGEPTAA
jgi:hypothetical protein